MYDTSANLLFWLHETGLPLDSYIILPALTALMHFRKASGLISDCHDTLLDYLLCNIHLLASSIFSNREKLAFLGRRLRSIWRRPWTGEHTMVISCDRSKKIMVLTVGVIRKWIFLKNLKIQDIFAHRIFSPRSGIEIRIDLSNFA